MTRGPSRRRRRRERTSAVSAIALGVLLTWGCGSDDGTSGAGSRDDDSGSQLGQVDAADRDSASPEDAKVEAEDARLTVQWDANVADGDASDAAGPDRVVQIAGGGGNFYCAAMASGTVRCWGDNPGGTLGDGTTVKRTTPVVVQGLTDAVSVSVGLEHACALRVAGTVVCWGRDQRGQLGDGRGLNDPGQEQHAPVAVPGLVAVQISAGGQHTCARRASGTVVCWGSDDFGQLGDGATTQQSSPVAVTSPLVLEDAIELSGGLFHTCARRATGTVVCWGAYSGESTPIAALSNVSQVSAGVYNTCVRLSNQSVSCWGDNSSGKSGATDFSSPVIAPTAVGGLSGVTQLSVGYDHTCARLASGGVRCFGADAYSQLGDGAITDTNVPVAVKNLTDAVEVAAGGSSTCARRATGSVVCWGDNSGGQLGDGTTNAHAAPAPVHNLP